MFDPKAAGEEADKLIQAMNQPQAEDHSVESTEAIVQDEPQSNDDQGVEVAPEVPRDDTNQRLEALAKQAEAAEQRWKVLQGMIDKKDGEIETLRALLAQVSASSEKTPVQEGTPKDLLTSQDSDAFGEDLIDMVKRGSMSVLQSELPRYLKAFEDRLAKLEGSVQGVQQVTAKTAQDMFFDSLAGQVPDWEAVNTDQGFLNWLNETDRFTGATRMELLQHAFGKQDVGRTAAFFLEYKRETGVEPLPKESKVAKLVAPGKAKTPTARVDNGAKRMWSPSEIAKLYADKREGRITAKQFEELERDIFAAQSEGRIAA